MTFIGYLMCWPTPRNAFLVALTTGLFVVRAIREERLPAGDASYQRYCRQVRWRFVPLFY